MTTTLAQQIAETQTLPMQYRALQTERANIDVEARTVELSFSSELPYERWYGAEILDHGGKAMRMGRLGAGAALLMDHDTRDQVGVVERAWIDKGKGRAVVRFGRSARAQEVWQDVQDGIRSLVSVGYAVHAMVLERSDDSGETYRVTDWEPYEISIVSVPADATVGIGRADGKQFQVRLLGAEIDPPKGTSQGAIMEVMDNAPAGASAETLSPDNARRIEQARGAALARLGESNKIPAGTIRGWIESGKTLDQAAEDVLKILSERANDDQLVGNLGMTNREANQYSLFRATRAIIDRNWSKAGLELKAHEEIQRRMGRAPKSDNSFFVPLDVLKRDLTVATGNAGGFLVSTTNQGFVDLLRNSTVLMQMGVTRLGGLTDNITIPRQTAGATAYWLANEGTSITESQMTLGQISLTPKTVGAYTEISRQLTLQSSPDVENLVLRDLAAQVGIDVDAKGLNGSGASGQPTGLLGTSGVGSVSGTSIAYAGIIEFQTDVFGANALGGSAGYVTTGAVAALLKQRVKFSSTASPLWEGRLEEATMDGYRAMASNNVPSATMIFGDWSQMLMAEWGVLEVDINPFANFQAGIIGVRAMYSVDFGVRVPGAFSVATSIT
jgi:HK97 family phage major capsid protein